MKECAFCNKEHILNDETIQVLKDSDNNIGLSTYTSIDELFDKLGLTNKNLDFMNDLMIADAKIKLAVLEHEMKSTRLVDLFEMKRKIADDDRREGIKNKIILTVCWIIFSAIMAYLCSH